MTGKDAVSSVVQALNQLLRFVTPAGRAVLVLGLTGALVGSWLNWQEGFFIASLALMALAVGWLFLLGSTDLETRLDLEPQRVVVGSDSELVVTVLNPRRRRAMASSLECPIGLRTASFLVPSVPKGASTVLRSDLPTAKRQVITVGPAAVVRSDPLSLFSRSTRPSELSHLFVHPRTVRLGELGSGFLKDLEGQPTVNLSDSDVAFHALREYQPGDDRRFVHWKTTARVGKLMIRQFVDTRKSHLAILLDTAPTSFRSDEEFELAVSCGASIGIRAMREGQEVSVTTGNGPAMAIGPQGLLDMLAGVIRLPKGSSLVDQAVRFGDVRGNVSIAVLVTGSGSPIKDLMLSVRYFGENSRVIIVRATQLEDSSIRRVGQAWVLSIPDLDDLAELLWKVSQ